MMIRQLSNFMKKNGKSKNLVKHKEDKHKGIYMETITVKHLRPKKKILKMVNKKLCLF